MWERGRTIGSKIISKRRRPDQSLSPGKRCNLQAQPWWTAAIAANVITRDTVLRPLGSTQARFDGYSPGEEGNSVLM